MKPNEEQPEITDAPQLRVFYGEEGEETDDRSPPDPDKQARKDWLEREKYWSGRNRAGRKSARRAA